MVGIPQLQQRNVINWMIAGLALLALVIIIVSINHYLHQMENTGAQDSLTSQNQVHEPQIIQVNRPVVTPIPVPVPVNPMRHNLKSLPAANDGSQSIPLRSAMEDDTIDNVSDNDSASGSAGTQPIAGGSLNVPSGGMGVR